MYNPNQSPSSRRGSEEFLRRMNQNQFSSCAPCGASTKQSHSFDSRQSNGGRGCDSPASGGCNQSGTPAMPALAMVYAPVQEWTCLMETPEMALAHGTLFKELLKPFDGRGSRRSGKC